MLMYKIRKKGTDLYLKGGSYWHKNGDSWYQLKTVKSRIKMLKDLATHNGAWAKTLKPILDNYEVVACELTVSSIINLENE